MQVAVTFRHLASTEALKAHAIERVSRLKKYLDDPIEAHVVLSVERFLHKADVTFSAHGMFVRGEDSSEDMYVSVDRAVEKIERQIKRYRHKLIHHRPKEGNRMRVKFKVLESATRSESEHDSELPPTIVEVKEIEARPMMLDEAVMQMDLLGNDVLVFLNSKTDHVNVLYRKKNDKYGLIETH